MFDVPFPFFLCGKSGVHLLILCGIKELWRKFK